MDKQQRQEFVQALLARDVLKFGEFTLKSGRLSPYFFNMGDVSDADGLALLGQAYADTVQRAGVGFDVLFGPAYKGIPLAVATALSFQQRGVNARWAFNRKEAKDHGEGGNFVGAPLNGRVLIVDDILTAGTAVREAAAMVQAAGGDVVGVVVALDRHEIMDGGVTAAEAVSRDLGVPVYSAISLTDVIDYLDLAARSDKVRADDLERVTAYQQKHCRVSA
ncbi:MAG: orotate phosphoribosyltransferase [Pseudomonadaceae bacterium]|nr:orotate phosphoribosyltransferase [Pseudomonadaceae bacterium]